MKRYDVVAIGDVNPDLVLAGVAAPAPVLGTEQYFGAARRVLGGSTAITAVLLSRLGAAVALVGRVGDDDGGRFCIEALRQAGVDTEWLRVDPDCATGLTIAVPYPADRLLLTAPGTIHRLTVADLPAGLLDSARHLHVGSFFMQRGLRADVAGLFRAARVRGVTTSLDTGWAPDADWAASDLEAALRSTDVFLPNESELLAVARGAGPDEAAGRLLALGTGEVVLKRGKHGAVLYVGGDRVRHDGFSVSAVDTTGAGDAFNAGYLVARLAGSDRSQRLSFANACGAVTACAFGGTDGIRCRDDVEALIAEVARRPA